MLPRKIMTKTLLKKYTTVKSGEKFSGWEMILQNMGYGSNSVRHCIILLEPNVLQFQFVIHVVWSMSRFLVNSSIILSGISCCSSFFKIKSRSPQCLPRWCQVVSQVCDKIHAAIKFKFNLSVANAFLSMVFNSPSC